MNCQETHGATPDASLWFFKRIILRKMAFCKVKYALKCKK